MSNLHRLIGVLVLMSLLLLMPAARAAITPGTIATFAGSGAGDGGPATNATMDQPVAIAVTAAGDVYFLDSNHCRIRKVSGGIISNAAGNDVCGYSPDGSPVLSSPVMPRDLAFGPDGSLYFVEDRFSIYESCRVRKVTAGLLTTVAGNGACGAPAEGANALTTSLAPDTMLAIDGVGNIYVSGKIDCRVWKISSGSGIINRLAGGTNCGTNFNADPLIAWIAPADIAVDASGANLYIADGNLCYIQKVSAGAFSHFAGTGPCGFAADGSPAASSQIQPRAIAVGSTDDVFYADGCRLERISAGILSAVATCASVPPGGPPSSADLAPQDVAVRGSGEVFMGEWESGPNQGTFQKCRVTTVQTSSLVVVAGSGACTFGGDGQAAKYASLSDPQTVGVDAAGNVYIGDRKNCRVRMVTASVITTIAGNACLASIGPPLGVPVPATQAAVSVRSMAVTPAGDIYLLDETGCRLRKISAGFITTIAGSGCFRNISDGIAVADVQFLRMTGIAVADNGTVYVSEGCAVWSVAAGIVHLVAGYGGIPGNDICATSPDGTPATAGSLDWPYGLAVRNGDMYVAERDACRVRVIHAGLITTVAGDPAAVSCGFAGDGGAATAATLNKPTSIAFDDAGALFIGDMGNCRVRKVQSGLIQSVAGSATCGFSGDGGSATDASLGLANESSPGAHSLGVTVNAHRDIYIADSGNQRIRVVYGDLCPNIVRADIDADHAVSILDLAQVAEYFLQSVPPAPASHDQDGDGHISILDLAQMSGVFLQSTVGCP